MRDALRYLAAAAVCAAFSGSTCISPTPTPKPERVAALRPFTSADELQTYLADQASAASQSTSGSIQLFSGVATGAAPMAATPAATPTEGGAQTTAADTTVTFSTTNVQEAGVDESDVVKNDDQTVYSLDGDTIHVVQAVPPAGLAEVATLTIDPYGDSLYLAGNRLVAISRPPGYGWSDGFGGGPAPMPMMGSSSVGVAEPGVVTTAQAAPDIAPPPGVILPPADQPQTTVTIFDITTPATPAVVAKVKLQGDAANTRLIGNKLHLVLTTVPVLPANPTPAALNAMPLEQWIPAFEVQAADGSTVSSGNVASWEAFLRPAYPDGYGIVTVLTMDVQDPTAPFASTAISADAGLIYASPAALYLTDTNFDYVAGSSGLEDTIVHKLAFTDTGTQYVASGKVPGRPLNQYSLGEYGGYLRIATHLSAVNVVGVAVGGGVVPPGAPVSSPSIPPNPAPTPTVPVPQTVPVSTDTNSVYVLGVNGASLDMIGKIEGIAPGEQLYAVRFVGDRGFVVTFRRIDPLFTVDLRDPTNPTVVGQLKVPGYSDHIQLLDENHLLTVGKDTQDAGSFAWVQGVQLSIFDITDMANPSLMYKEVIGSRGTTSEANYNPKAFNYFAPLNALALPIDLFENAQGGPVYGTHSFSGLYVYRVTLDKGFELLGRIATANTGPNPSGCFADYYGYTRGVFIADAVYSVSQMGVKAAALSDVSTVAAQVTFTAPTPPVNCWFGPMIAILPVGTGVQ